MFHYKQVCDMEKMVEEVDNLQPRLGFLEFVIL